MPCLSLTFKGVKCSIPCKGDVCHIHEKKQKLAEAKAKALYKIDAQRRELSKLNNRDRELRSRLQKEEIAYKAALSEIEELKAQVMALAIEKKKSDVLQESLYSQIKDLDAEMIVCKDKVVGYRRLKRSEASLKKQVVELTESNQSLRDEVDELSSMRDDYDRYQTIKYFERVHKELCEAYNVKQPLDLAKAMRTAPAKGIKVLGPYPWKHYHELRMKRNAAAHAISPAA
ncbi:unnamed protein product [Phytophthora lilii]|uniref:Unnamed protein product n=1 Tax=Phytophthora lilii TaxID=2077276 RepID=A0A9W6YKL5_9STRA|nr:unnamed protein product [Phytophthora lilii]